MNTADHGTTPSEVTQGHELQTLGVIAAILGHSISEQHFEQLHRTIYSQNTADDVPWSEHGEVEQIFGHSLSEEQFIAICKALKSIPESQNQTPVNIRPAQSSRHMNTHVNAVLSKIECANEPDMMNSAIEAYPECAGVRIGRNLKLTDARLVIKKGARLNIGDLCEIRGTIIVEENSSVTIGHGLVCNDRVHIQSAEGGSIKIGNDCLFADARIYNSDMHGIYSTETWGRINRGQDVTIGNRVWLAMGSMILKGAELGDNTVVGAGAVASKIYPSNCVLAGNPAAIVKQGTAWSRIPCEEINPVSDVALSAAELSGVAIRMQHDEVLRLGGQLLQIPDGINANNCHLFYYVARAALLAHIIPSKDRKCKVGPNTVDLATLADIFERCFIASRKRNKMAGGYACMTHSMLGQDEKTAEIHKDLSGFSQLKSGQFAPPWTI